MIFINLVSLAHTLLVTSFLATRPASQIVSNGVRA